MFLLLLAVPIAIGAVVAAAFAGWSGAAVAVGICLALVIVGAVAVRFAVRMFGSVRDLVGLTERLSRGEYSARVAPSSSRLLRPASDSFNLMAERLETSDDLRHRLLADVGHEMRTPLTIIRGELEAIADGVRELDDERIRLLLADVAGMERLVDDLKSLSEAEAGVLAFDFEPTDLGVLVDDVAARFAADAAAQGVELAVMRAEAAESLEALVDPYRVGEVFTNLLANALRAAARGGAVQVLAGADVLDGRPAVVIEVADDGPGIPADRLAAVFERFNKGAESDGSGLGLTISRELVRAHGGSIEASSEPGEGTKMTVRLPRSSPRRSG